MATGPYVTLSLGGARYARLTHKKAREIEVSLMDGAAAIQAVRLLTGYRTGARKASTASGGAFKTRDGFIQINTVRAPEFARFCDVLSSAGLQNEVVQSHREFVEYPQAREIDVFAWLEQAGREDPWPVPNSPGLPNFIVGEVMSKSPTVGQHTRDVLAGLGFATADIDRLYADKTVA